MLSAYVNSYKIPELRKRLLFTFALVALTRLLCFIPCPGVDPSVLTKLLGSLGGNGEGGPLASLFLSRSIVDDAISSR